MEVVVLTIGIVSPGAMGSALGRAWAGGGARVVATVAGRSDRTRRLVLTAYIRPVAWIDDAVMAAARQHRLATLSPGRTLNGDLAFPIVDEHPD